MKTIYRLLLALSMLAVTVLSCEFDPIDDSTEGEKAEPQGTLRVLFKKSHVWLPEDKMVRTDLHIARDGTEIYKGNYLYSANVNDYQESYDFHLPTGTYYYEAGIACICGGDTCSAAGFPGNQFGGKHTMGKFTIYEDEITTVTPTFQ